MFCAAVTFLQYFKNIKQGGVVSPLPVISRCGAEKPPVLYCVKTLLVHKTCLDSLRIYIAYLYRVYIKKLNKFETALTAAKRLKV